MDLNNILGYFSTLLNYTPFILTVVLISSAAAIQFFYRNPMQELQFLDFMDIIRMDTSPADLFKWYYDNSEDEIHRKFIFKEPSYMIKYHPLVESVFGVHNNELTGDFGGSELKMSNDLFQLFKRSRKEYLLESALKVFSPEDKFAKIKTICEELPQKVSNLFQVRPQDIIDIQEVCSRFIIDVIAHFVYDTDVDHLRRSESEFRKIKMYILEMFLIQRIKFSCEYLMPCFQPYFSGRIHNTEEYTAYFTDIILDAFRDTGGYGLSTEDLNSIVTKMRGQNMTQLCSLLETDECFAAEVATFYVVKYGASFGSLSLALYELALQPEMQNRLRDEIRHAFNTNHGKMVYDMIKNMRYLDMVVLETLRKYPHVTFMQNKYSMNSTHTLPEPAGSFFIPSDALLFASIIGAHQNPEFYPDPQKFDPERFTRTKMKKRYHFRYIPFGVGSSIEPAQSFAMLVIKLGLTYFVRHFEFKLCPQTPEELQMDPLYMYLAPQGKLPLLVRKI